MSSAWSPLLMSLFSTTKMVTDVNATASMYDNRTSLDIDENKGCYTTGCLPSYTLDGLLNDEAESRWSCAEDIDLTIGICYITFDLYDSYTLTELKIFFHKSDDLERDPNPFEISISADNVMYEFSFSGNNTLGTPLGTGENFSFPEGSSGQYVRLTGILEEGQWLSINEVEIYVEVVTPSPTVDVTDSPTGSPSSTLSGSPTASPTESVDPTASPSRASTIPPNQALTPTSTPTLTPTLLPTPVPTLSPTPVPTNIPTLDVVPTATPSPSPPVSMTDDDIGMTPAPSTLPPTVATDDDNSDGDTSNTPAIIGGVAGAAVLLAVIGFVVYRRINTSPQPPSYDDIVGAN